MFDISSQTQYVLRLQTNFYVAADTFLQKELCMFVARWCLLCNGLLHQHWHRCLFATLLHTCKEM